MTEVERFLAIASPWELCRLTGMHLTRDQRERAEAYLAEQDRRDRDAVEAEERAARQPDREPVRFVSDGEKKRRRAERKRELYRRRRRQRIAA